MKSILLLPLVLALPAFAGTSAKQVITPPPANPCLMSWFAGASVGYLTELEEPMYNVHLGVTNSCWMICGWNVSAYAEVGYTDTSWNDSWYEGTTAQFLVKEKVDYSIVPITANIKFERALSGNLNAYFGVGLGMAWIDCDRTEKHVMGTYHYSDSDWVFTAQVFAGLSYSVSPNFEIYGGARWIYYADSSLFGSSQDLDDDWLLELGARYKF